MNNNGLENNVVKWNWIYSHVYRLQRTERYM